MEVLVIGAGLGGLFCGALLSKEGYRVTVLEKNAGIGGGLQNFVRKGEMYETGMHVAGGFHENGSLKRICCYLGIMDRLDIRFSDLMSSLTYLDTDRTFNIPSGRDRFTAYLISLFPHEEENIKRYVDALFRLSEEDRLFYMKSGQNSFFDHSEEFTMPADKFIASYIDSPELRSLLAFVNPLYAGVAGHSPAYLHAMISVMFIDKPCCFVKGSSQLADALASVITEAGGSVITSSAVTRTVVRNRRVESVYDSNGKEYKADVYISAIHPCTLLDTIEGRAFTPFYKKRLRNIPSTVSAFKVYAKLKKGHLPYAEHSVNIIDSKKNTWKMSRYRLEDWPHGISCFLAPSSDGKWATHITILSLMDWKEVSRWKNTRIGNRGDEYEMWKRSRMEKVIEMAEKVFPDLRDSIEDCFAASPLTFRDYLGTKEGSIYGYFKDSENLIYSQLSIRTKIENLLLTGQNVNMHGIGGVPMTAIETAEILVGKDVIVNKINLYENIQTEANLP
ncbi:MAG: Dehydrosqualene desaturase [Bacteroidetes bacterium ADurb.BinA104]|nr:MAG: Dehydrosqualene desaturase [Bacteroidetes bacterium ADurb.BinA104]